jgi:hypothetical protein
MVKDEGTRGEGRGAGEETRETKWSVDSGQWSVESGEIRASDTVYSPLSAAHSALSTPHSPLATLHSPLHSSPSRVFVSGYPGDVGGANTECWHTLRLWRDFGLEITLLPTWKATPKWRARLDAIGCRTIETAPESLAQVPGLAGSIVVSFCNANFLAVAGRFRDLGCSIVWLGCMNWLFGEERKHYHQRGPFERYVFQSLHQQQEVQPQLEKFGVRPEQCHGIHGAFCAEEFPFRPLEHAPGTPLVVGRISRAAEDKYSSNTWPIYRKVPHPIRARLMAWDRRVQQKLGPPPEWAECLPAGAETSQEFLAKLHCMVQVNGGAGENWPRSGLEAMATGVPIVVQNQWGWREMIRHGQTGFLCSNDDELAFYAARLAYDEDLRLAVAYQARRSLEEELANPEVIWGQWRTLLEGLR